MASTKITELTAASTIAVSDVLPFVSDPSGSPTTKKITANNLANSILTSVLVSVVPSSNNTLNLGSAAKNWNNVYIKALHANGSVGSNGYVLFSNGSASYWSSTTPFNVNVSAQYTWTNNHTFDGTITFSSNIVGTVNNSLYLGSKQEADLNVNNAVNFDGLATSDFVRSIAAPANSTASGVTGQIAWDSNSIYVCVNTNTWKKVDLSSF